MDISKLSRRYAVRALDEADAEDVLRFCEKNTVYYQYCGGRPSLEQVKRDMTLLPEGVAPEQKHYMGFFDGDALAAVMDCVEAYPDDESAYIGFFMVNSAMQGRGTGTGIITEAMDYLKSMGVSRIRLAIAKDNPQATHFWFKNGFEVVREADMDGWTALVADRHL